MEVTHYKDADGVWYLEIRSRHYQSLKELQAEHEKLGRKCNFNLYDTCQGIWVLTVQMNVAVAA